MSTSFALMGTLALSGVLSAVSVVALLALFDLYKVAGYHLLVDVIFSTVLVIVYAGTFSGMITAFFGGLTLSIFLYLFNRMCGYKKLTRTGWVYHIGW